MRTFLLIFWLILWIAPSAGATAPIPARSPVQQAGESLSYDIALLWFDRIAEGRFSLGAGPRPGTWRAELEARTLGVAGWLTGERVQRYVSIMEEMADGRLRPLSHEAHILSGTGKAQRNRGKRYFFDHDSGTVRYQRLKNGAIRKEEFLPFDRTHPPLDILTAFVGFRAGLAGPLLPGRRYLLPTFSHRGVSDIVVETIAEGERSPYPFPPHGLLARVRLDPEVFDTGGGDVFIWLDERGRPAAGIVENIIGLGNVYGTLRQNP